MIRVNVAEAKAGRSEPIGRAPAGEEVVSREDVPIVLFVPEPAHDRRSVLGLFRRRVTVGPGAWAAPPLLLVGALLAGCPSHRDDTTQEATTPAGPLPAAPAAAPAPTGTATDSDPPASWTDGLAPDKPTLQAAMTTVTSTHHRARYEEGPAYTVLDRRLRITRPDRPPLVMLVEGEVGLSPDGAHLLVLHGTCPELETVENASPDRAFRGSSGPLIVALGGGGDAAACQPLPVSQLDGGSIAWSKDSRRVAWITVTAPDENAWMVIYDRRNGAIRTAAVGSADCPCGSPCTGPPLVWAGPDRVEVLGQTNPNGVSVPPERTYDARLDASVPCTPPDEAATRSFDRAELPDGSWLFTWGAGTYVAVAELRDRACATIATFSGAAIEVAPDRRTLAVYTPVGGPLAEQAALRLYRLPAGTALPPVRLPVGARVESLEWKDELVVADVVVGEGRSQVTAHR
jgi:hypothetical protein